MVSDGGDGGGDTELYSNLWILRMKDTRSETYLETGCVTVSV